MKSSELLRILKKDGWFEVRRAGSHMIMRHAEKEGSLSVPFHGPDEVKKRLLSDILKKANIKITKR